MSVQMKVRQIREREVEVPGLGASLESARRKTGKSVTALCKEVGISRNYWYQLVDEKITGALLEGTLRKLEQALDADLGVDFEGGDRPQ